MTNNIVKFGGSQIISMPPGSSASSKTLTCAGKVSSQNITVTSASDANLVSSNIRRGKSIFGVSGDTAILRKYMQYATSAPASGTVTIKIDPSSSHSASVRYIDITAHGFTPVYWSFYEWYNSDLCYGYIRIGNTFYRHNQEYTSLDNLLFTSSHCYVCDGFSDVIDYTADIFGY